MSKYIYYKKEIFPYFDIMVDFLINQRKDIENQDLRASVNLNIILCTACHIEGFLENRAKGLLRYYQEVYRKVYIPEFEVRKPMNTFFNAVIDNLENSISRCTGVDKYNEYFKLLLGQSIQSDASIKDCMEAINVLFQLRNVIAHSREISAYEKFSWENPNGEETFLGGYKKAETLLLKEGIIKDKFIESDSAEYLLTDSVADYFLNKSQKFLIAIDNFLNESIQVKDFMEDFVDEFNKLHNTNLSVQEFLSNIKLEITTNTDDEEQLCK